MNDSKTVYLSNEGPRVSIKVEKNTKGYNFEATVSDARTPEEALELMDELIAGIQSRLVVATSGE